MQFFIAKSVNGVFSKIIKSYSSLSVVNLLSEEAKNKEFDVHLVYCLPKIPGIYFLLPSVLEYYDYLQQKAHYALSFFANTLQVAKNKQHIIRSEYIAHYFKFYTKQKFRLNILQIIKKRNLANSLLPSIKLSSQQIFLFMVDDDEVFMRQYKENDMELKIEE